MKKLILIVWLIIFASPAFATTHVELSDSEKIATEFVEQLVQGEYRIAHSAFDPAMAATMPTKTLRKSWIKLQTKTGDFKTQSKTKVEQNPHYDVVNVRCAFERLDVDVKVVVENNKIAGLYFVRADS